MASASSNWSSPMHIHLGVGLLVGLDQLVCLVEPWVFEVVLAELDLRNAKQSDLHTDL